MASLTYIGPTPSAPRDVETRLETESVLNQGVSRSYVIGRVNYLIAASRASKVYVDEQDAQFAEASYFPAKDALLVPLTAKGAANGVATLDNAGKIPPAQVPVLGTGILHGPYGHNQAYGGTSEGGVPLKIAQWNLGSIGFTGVPLAWMSTSAQTNGARPVVEIRVGTPTQTAYADQTMIARGFGRSLYSDYQLITVIPATALDGEGQDGVQDSYPSTTALLANAWLYTDDGSAVTTSTTSIVTAALFIARTTL